MLALSRATLLIFMASLLMLSSGCKNGRVDARALGLTSAPDAFNIETNDSLEVPTSLKKLPRPNANAPDLQDTRTSSKVGKILGVPEEQQATAGEIGLLQQTGGLTASDKIRDVIVQDRISILDTKKKKSGFFDKFRSTDNPELGDVALDTVIESDQLTKQGIEINSRKHRIRRLRQGLPASIY
jgi:hypothetical protein